MSASNVRQAMFPYGMARNGDGSWTFFNRDYKPLGVVSEEWIEWDDPNHKMRLKGLTPALLAKLDHKGVGTEDRIHFYNDGCNPENSAADLNAYLQKLGMLIGLKAE